MMREDFVRIVKTLRGVFASATPYFAQVPIYVSGIWSWTFAADTARPLAYDDPRAGRLERVTRYYNREIHRAAFAQPQRREGRPGRLTLNTRDWHGLRTPSRSGVCSCHGRLHLATGRSAHRACTRHALDAHARLLGGCGRSGGRGPHRAGVRGERPVGRSSGSGMPRCTDMNMFWYRPLRPLARYLPGARVGRLVCWRRDQHRRRLRGPQCPRAAPKGSTDRGDRGRQGSSLQLRAACSGGGPACERLRGTRRSAWGPRGLLHADGG